MPTNSGFPPSIAWLLLLTAFTFVSEAQGLRSLAICNTTCTNTNSSLTGAWSLQSPTRGDAYVAANLSSTDIGSVVVRFNLRTSVPGNYSITVYTPGCIQDNSCSVRGIVNVTATVGEGLAESRTQLAQTNNFNKYDQVYYGPINATSHFVPTVEFVASGAVSDLYMVAQKVTAILIREATVSSQATSSVATSTSSPITSLTANPASDTGTTDQPSHSLSTGAKTGSGLGVPLGLIFLGALLALVFIVRRRRHRKPGPSSSVGLTNRPPRPLPAEMGSNSADRRELPANASISEMPSSPAYNQVPLTERPAVVHELKAT